MKKVLTGCFTVALALASIAAGASTVLQWDASDGAEGYNAYCGPTPVSAVAPVDVGAEVTYDLIGVVSAGIQYECWVTAYAAGFPESGESNHIQFTLPTMVQTILVYGQPSSVTVSWQ